MLIKIKWVCSIPRSQEPRCSDKEQKMQVYIQGEILEVDFCRSDKLDIENGYEGPRKEDHSEKGI